MSGDEKSERRTFLPGVLATSLHSTSFFTNFASFLTNVRIYFFLCMICKIQVAISQRVRLLSSFTKVHRTHCPASVGEGEEKERHATHNKTTAKKKDLGDSDLEIIVASAVAASFTTASRNNIRVPVVQERSLLA